MSSSVYYLEAGELDIELSDDQVNWSGVYDRGGSEWRPESYSASGLAGYRIAPPATNTYEAFPHSTQHNGVITTSWVAQTAHGVDEGQATLYAESADGGNSYGPTRQFTYPSEGTWGIVSAVRYPDGELVMLHGRTGVSPGRRGIISRGQTYAQQRFSSETLPWGPSWHFPSVLAVAGGILWAGCYSGDGVRLLRSYDRGYTWQTVTVPDAVKTAQHTEHWLVDTDDAVMLLVRYDPPGGSSTESRIETYVTTDHGRTWRQTTSIEACSGLPQATRTTDGAILVVVRWNRIGQNKELAAMAITRDNGKSWRIQVTSGDTWGMYGTILQTSEESSRYIAAHQPRNQAEEAWLYSQPLRYMRSDGLRAAGPAGDDPAWCYPIEYTWGREHPLGHATDGAMTAQLWIPDGRDTPVKVGQWARLVANMGWKWTNGAGREWFIPKHRDTRTILWTGVIASVDRGRGSRVAKVVFRDIIAVARSLSTVGPRKAPEEPAAKRVTRINQLAGTICENIAASISGGTVEPASSTVQNSALQQLIQAHRLGVVLVPNEAGTRVGPRTVQVTYVKEATAVEPISLVVRTDGNVYEVPAGIVESIAAEDTRADAIHHVSVKLGFGAAGDSHTGLRGTGKTLSLETGIYDTSARAYEIALGIMQRIRNGISAGRVVIPGIWRGKHADGYAVAQIINYIQPVKRHVRPIAIEGHPSIQFPTSGKLTLTPSVLGNIAGRARIELQTVSGEAYGMQYHTAATLKALPSPPTFGGAGTKGPAGFTCLRKPPDPYN